MSKVCPVILFARALFACALVFSPGLGFKAHAVPISLPAMSDDFQAVRYNPAALAQGAASGVALGFDFAGTASDADPARVSAIDLFLNTDIYAHSFRYNVAENRLDQQIGLAIPLVDSFSIGLGAQLRGIDFAGIDLSGALLFRPVPYISLAAVGGVEALERPYINFSLALRPFTDNITIAVGSRFDGRIYLPTLAAHIEPANGIRIDGGINFDDLSWNVGVSVSFSHFRVGADVKAQEANYRSTSSYVHVSPHQFHSLLSEPPGRFVQYSLGAVVDQAPRNPFAFVGGPQVSELVPVIQEIREICADPSVRGVVFKESTVSASLANFEELRQAFAQCKAQEKPIIFYASNYGNLGYAFAASIADEIYMHEGGQISLVGYSVLFPYFKSLLDELGVGITVFQSHEDKSAGEPLVLQGMSDSTRSQYERIVANHYQVLISMLEERSLGIGADEAVNSGPYLNSRYALEVGLVDGLMYEDDFDNYMSEQGWLVVPHPSAEKLPRTWPDISRQKVALIHASGRISEGQSIRGIATGDDSIIPAIERAQNDASIRAIVLRIDSPGGSAIASDHIARAVSRAAERKPVLVWMGAVAASGGYFIASPASSIIASPATVTGSIGVLATFPNFEALIENLGVSIDGVRSSPSADYNDLLWFLREPSEREKDILQERIDWFYDLFVERVAGYRGVSPQEIDAVAQGQIWSGSEALQNGLVDQLGGYALVMEELERILGTGHFRLEHFDHVSANAASEFLLALAQTVFPDIDINLLGILENELLGKIGSEHESEILYQLPWTIQSQN